MVTDTEEINNTKKVLKSNKDFQSLRKNMKAFTK